ncbi:hypothetical protein M3Y97_00016900 [Aphelenchoides bicaudatus]|nr:hypothetical protein M3Y97_00016900 [Aphelenchoides bicaudatus]
MLDGFTSTTLLAYAAGIFHSALILVAIVLIKFLLTDIRKKAVGELNKMSAILSTTTESLNFAETPVAAICLIANYMKIPVEEVAAEYAAEANNRKAIVTQTFRKDAVTDGFLSKYNSKFVSQGYLGEELLRPT